MSETTQGFSQNHALNVSHSIKPTGKTGIDLAPVFIVPSQLLLRLQLLMYGAMLFFASAAIYPFIFTAFYWPLLWLLFALLIAVAMWSAWRNKHKSPINLSVIQKVWRLQMSAEEIQVEPCEEILLWESVIVVPVRELLTKRKHRIVALSDSMSAEDWRRLRVWLRMGLKYNV